MRGLRKLFKMKLTKSNFFLLLLSLAGFFDSSYLAILELKHVVPPCSIVKGCEIVLTSKFAMILGIPMIALSGCLFFLILILILLLENQQNRFFKYFKLLLLVGVVFSIILIYVQAVILHAFCQYCLLVEAIVFTIFILSYPLNSSSR